LKRLHEEGVSSGVMAEHLTKLRNILARLAVTGSIEDVNYQASAFAC
jgi:hypothetical protein